MSHATSFGAAVDDYEQGRPGYPADAVAWLMPGAPERVLDLGAGTGKLTSQLALGGTEVVAVDPDPEMLAALTRAVPGVETAVGTAESIPLADGSIDAVVVGQAWHWFDPDPASKEIARVLRPGGTLGLIWNIRDSRVPWVARLSHAMRGSAAERLIEESGPVVGAPFGPLTHDVWEWSRPMTEDELRAMVRSRSYYITGTDSYRGQVDSDVDALLTDLRAQPGDISLPYVTHAFRATRP